MQPGSLAYKIFIDRFALKDLTRTNLKVGDMVLVHTHPGSELGKVLEILDSDQVKVQLPNKVAVYHVDHVDKPVETSYDQCCGRVASAIPTRESNKTYRDMVDHKFVPAGRILAGAGSGQSVTLANCYIIKSPHDSRGGIYESLTKWSELLSRGGGVGTNFSTLRPKGALVKGVNGRSSGAVSWMEMFSQAVKTIIQGGCMHKDSLVHTSRGLIKITEVKVGDSVMTEDGYHKVTNVFNNGVKDLYSLTLSNGKNIKCTLEHKFLVLDKSTGKMYKKELGSVTSGDVLQCYDHGSVFSEVHLSHLEYYSTEEVYDLEVDVTHTYVCDGMLVSNSRMGASMIMLNDWHPDLLEFISVKKDPNKLTGANISIGLSDDFMESVQAGGNWTFRFPDTQHPQYDSEWDGDILGWEAKGYPVIKYNTIESQELWRIICESAHASAEPGLFFLDRCNKLSNSHYFNKLTASNPCIAGGELISTTWGQIAIKNLVGLDFVGILIDSRFGKGYLACAKGAYSSGVKPVYRLDTESGWHTRCTYDHRIMTNRGWVMAKDLTPEDEIHILHNPDFGYGLSIPETTRFKYLAYEALEEVYDISVPGVESFASGGIVVHNCAEQPLPDFGLCMLGHIHLAKFARSSMMFPTQEVTKFTGSLNQWVEVEDLRATVRNAIEFLDNSLDHSFQPLEEVIQRVKQERRIGLGTLGLGELLITLGFRYGSEASVVFCNELYEFIMHVAYHMSEELANLKGSFSAFNVDGYLASGFVKNNPLIQDIRNMRNVCLLTQAPTGSVGTMMGTSTGIEPYYSFTWERTSNLGKNIEVASVVQDYATRYKVEPTKENLPSYFVNAMDGSVSVEGHIAIQAVVQKYTCSAVSKTINVPESYTVGQVKEA